MTDHEKRKVKTMEEKMNHIIDEYAECKVNAEENLKVLASQHSLELSTAKDKLKQIIKSKTSKNLDLSKDLEALRISADNHISILKSSYDRAQNSEKSLKRRLKVHTESTMEQMKDALISIVGLQKQLANENALRLRQNDSNKGMSLLEKRSKDPFWFVIPNFLVQVASPDGKIKSVKWEGHVGKKNS